MQRIRMMLVCATVLSAAAGCSKDKAAEQKLAPTASALEAAMPKAPTASAFAVDSGSSSFTLLDGLAARKNRRRRAQVLAG